MLSNVTRITSRSDERHTVLHSWCVQNEWDAPTIVGGEGAWVHTADGRSILDMSSLAECSNLGHQLCSTVSRSAGVPAAGAAPGRFVLLSNINSLCESH